MILFYWKCGDEKWITVFAKVLLSGCFAGDGEKCKRSSAHMGSEDGE